MKSIGEALEGRTLLVTGATGFLAKALVEKLVRDVPGIRRIYLLIRPRHGGNGTRLTAEDRFWRDIVSTSVFDRLRRDRGDGWKDLVCERVRPVAGNLADDRLGMEESVYEALTREVDVVVNSAATVSFDERLDSAIQTNMLGPRRLVAFAKRCQGASGRPVLYLHVSTAYVSGWREGAVPEKPFGPGDSVRALRGEPDAPVLDLDEEIRYCREARERIEAESKGEKRSAAFRRRALREASKGASEKRIEKRVETIRQQFVKERLVELGMERAHRYGWNDTYTFTKALGEMLVVRERGDLPTVVLRPSIIESSMREPEPGWLDGFRMADPLIMAFGKGVLRDFPAVPDVRVDVVPVDYVVNVMVAAMARPPVNSGLLDVFHVATGTVSPLSFQKFYDLLREYFMRNPMVDRAGRPITVAECSYPSEEVFTRKLRLKYLLPLTVAGWLADRSPLIPRRMRARLASRRSAVQQALYYSDLYGPYVRSDYDFEIKSTLALYDDLRDEDRDRFPFDIRGIDWRRYVQDIHIPGLKLNVLKMGSTNGRRIKSTPTAGEIELSEWAGDDQETIYDVLEFVAGRHGPRIALEMDRRGDEREEFTYQGLFDAARRAAETFASCGVARGDRIVLWAESRPSWGAAYLGAAGSGITVVPVDPQTTPEELGRIVHFTGAALVVASNATFRRLRDDNGMMEAPILDLDNGLEPFEGIPASHGGPVRCTWGEVEPHDVASIIFTSGTTVDPKAVLLTHRNILSDAMAVGKVLRPYTTDRFISVLPLHHVFEFTGGFLMPLWGGAKITYVETLKSRVILETMRRTRTTCMLGVPRIFEILHEGIHKRIASLSLPKRIAFRTSLGMARLWRFVTGKSAGRFFLKEVHKHFGGSVRLFVSGGAALDPQVCDSFSVMGFPISEGYGLTETSPVLTVNPLRRARPGSVGQPLPGVELRIDDPDENGVGEIVVRGDMLMEGYLQNPDATRRMLRHGWLHTGDLGFQDADGYVYITGRSKDLIVTPSGKNVYPDEVETLYRRAIPHLQEICVVGIRAPGGHSEEVHAVIVPDWKEWNGEPDHAEWSRRAREAIQAASRNLPTYQRIQKVHSWKEELPKTATMKVQRRLVREAILAGRDGNGAPLEEVVKEEEAPVPDISSVDIGRLTEVIASITKVPRSEITTGAHLHFDLGMDSLMKVELLAALEEAVQVRIPDNLAAELTTVEDVAALIAVRKEAERASTRTAYWERVIAGPAPEDGGPPPRRPWATGLIRRFVRWVGGAVYRKYFRIRVQGIENVPDDGACIFVANHASHLDSGAVLAALGARANGLRLVAAKDYFFRSRILGWFFRNIIDAIPFDRRERFIEGLRVCRATLDRGHRLLIFPEGTRSVTGQLQPFKAGVGLLALKSRVPVIPIRIRGTHAAMPKGSFWPRPSRIRVAFGEAIPISPLDGDASYEIYRRVADLIRSRVEELA